MTLAVLVLSLFALQQAAGVQSVSPAPGEQNAAAPGSPLPIAVSARYPAVGPPAPALVYAGGRFLRHPRVVTITWKGDNDRLVSRLEAFGAWITRGAWWTTVTTGLCARAGDCMGPGGEASGVRLDEPFPGNATLAALATRMATLVDRGVLPEPVDERIFLAYLPRGSTPSGITDACAPVGTRAVHTTFAWPQGAAIAAWPVAFVFRCGEDIGELTATASHEILEAASDPTLDGFRLEQAPRARPFTFDGVEAVDLCKLVTLDDHRTYVDGWVVQRAWSNEEARAGRDPCVPHRADDPYVAVVPKEPVVTLIRGTESAVIHLTGISDRAVPAWSVAAFELAALRGARPCFTFELDRREVTNGSALSLTIRLMQPACAGSPVLLVSTLGTRSDAWPVVVEVK
jgi:hypothetical protein